MYRQWCDLLQVKPGDVNDVHQIPFMPIEFFKHHQVLSAEKGADSIVFTSSATTSQTPSKHVVTDVRVYEKSFLSGFHLFYGLPAEYCFLALLPSYLQRTGSSLVYMCDRLIKESRHPDSGFFLDDIDLLLEKIDRLRETRQKTLLIGVSYALLDLCEKKPRLGDHFIVMETGGMKGRRKEMLKPELHAFLRKGLGVSEIHSEYGMTELLSQAYSHGDGLFEAPPWMRFLTRETDDPLQLRMDSRTGGLNVIDLANYNSCSFIATKDLARLHPGGKIELMGRYDDSDVRGCNLMIEF